jgi:hypothetical protein
VTCSERENLLKAYVQAGRHFDDSRAELQARIGVSRRDEYKALDQAVESAWEVLGKARNALDAHVREHRCEGLP